MHKNHTKLTTTPTFLEFSPQTKSSHTRELSPYDEKIIEFTIAAVESGAAIPRNKLEKPPKAFVVLEKETEEAKIDDVCSRTLYVSKGCPIHTDADPAIPPAIRSWNAVMRGGDCGGWCCS